MIFNGKSYGNVQFPSICENKEHEWSHDFLRIAKHFMFKKVSEKKEIKLFKEHAVASIVN